MARGRHTWRLVVGWLLTLSIVVYAITDLAEPREPKLAATSDDSEPTATLRITALSDAEVNPGDAVVVKFQGAAPSTPLEARVARHPAEIVVREADTLVVRIPPATPSGKVGLRLLQGSLKSKAWDLHVRTTNHRKLVGRLVGGLALFVFGLGLLALGMRGLAGNRLRDLLGRVTESRPRALAVGALVGASTQLTSSSAAVTVSLVESRVLRVVPAVAVLVGAQLGAAITCAVIPVQLSGESLLLIPIGVLWTRLARSRRGRAIANVVLGAGLMLYGLHLLQTSIEPLVGDPAILPYLAHLRSPGIAALARCAITGALLAVLLQGPGPVYILVVGLAQTTTVLPLDNALAILAGTNLGAAVVMAIIAWQAGATTRPLARTQLWFGVAATVVLLSTIPIWSAVADRIVPEASAVDYGHSVVRERIAPQLAVGFAAGELVAGAVWLLALPALMRSVGRVSRSTPQRTSDAPVERDLVEALDKLRRALALALDMSCTGNRAPATEAESSLEEARRLLESRYRGLDDPESGSTRDAPALVACLQLQRAVEQAVQVAELCVERAVRLGDDASDRLTTMHAIAGESFDALLVSLAEGTAPDLEDAGAREIRMNALEAEGRKIAVARERPRRAESTSSLQIGFAELVDSFENVGNHLFRVAKVLGDEDVDGRAPS